MEFIADIVIVAIVAISVIIGYRRGFVRMLFKCLTIVAAIAVAYYAGPYLGSHIKSTKVYVNMSENVTEQVSEYFSEVAISGIEGAQQSKSDFEKTPLAETLSRAGFDSEKLLDHYKTTVISGAENVKDKYVEKITDYVLSCLANALGHLVVFILALIVIKLLGIIVQKIFDLPVLKTVNKAGGGIVGAIFGLVIAYIACISLEVVLPYIPENPVVYVGMADKTYIYRYFVDFNPMVFFLLG